MPVGEWRLAVALEFKHDVSKTLAAAGLLQLCTDRLPCTFILTGHVMTTAARRRGCVEVVA